MNKILIVLIATLLSITVYAKGPGEEPGATGIFLEVLLASESSDDLTTNVSLSRGEHSDGYSWGNVYGNIVDTYFDCELVSDTDLLKVQKDAESAVIHVGLEDIDYCWFGWLPEPITFDCKASGYMGSQGISNYETFYFNGNEYKYRARYAENAVDCVVYLSNDVVLDASSGTVRDGMINIQKSIQPNQE